MKVGSHTNSPRGWTVLSETGLGSWADEMEDMPLPCKLQLSSMKHSGKMMVFADFRTLQPVCTWRTIVILFRR
jgi:hypothetical protein